MSLKIYITIISLLVLAGCNPDRVKPEPDVQIVYRWQTFDCGVPPARDKVSFRPITWEIIDSRYTLSTDDYASLGENIGEIIKASGQMAESIRFYIECIDSANNPNP